MILLVGSMICSTSSVTRRSCWLGGVGCGATFFFSWYGDHRDLHSFPTRRSSELTVEHLDDGEVSPYLADEVQEGDQLELRGPIGLYFVWQPGLGGPLLLVAGGSGVVPLMAMLRHRAASGSRVPTRLLYSSRTLEDVIYREELEGLAAAGDGLTVTHTLTRAQPPGWQGYNRRIDAAMLKEVGWPTRLVEAVADDLVALGHDPFRVKTERFGPTGVQ